MIACSILALALVIERFLSLKVAKVAPPSLLDEVMTVTRNGVPGAEVINQLEKNSALGEVLASGLRTLTQNPRCSDDELRVGHGKHRPPGGAPAGALPECAGRIAPRPHR